MRGAPWVKEGLCGHSDTIRYHVLIPQRSYMAQPSSPNTYMYHNPIPHSGNTAHLVDGRQNRQNGGCACGANWFGSSGNNAYDHPPPVGGGMSAGGAEERTEEQGLFITAAAVSRDELVAHEAPLLAIQSADR